MDVKTLQEKSVEAIKKIDRKLNVTHDKKVTMFHMVEEMGEVAREMYNEETGREKMDKENLRGEVADPVMLISHLAHLYGIDMGEAVKDKMSRFKERFGVEI